MNNYLDCMFSEEEGGQKRFWRYIKSRKQEATGVAPLKNSNGITKSDSVEKAKEVNTNYLE